MPDVGRSRQPTDTAPLALDVQGFRAARPPQVDLHDPLVGMPGGARFVLNIERFADLKRRIEIANAVVGQESRDVVRRKPRMVSHATILYAARLNTKNHRDEI